MQLENKVALATGAAHRGGKAIALSLASEGAHVVIHYGGSACKQPPNNGATVLFLAETAAGFPRL